MQQTSTLEPVFRVLFAMLAYAVHTVAPNTNNSNTFLCPNMVRCIHLALPHFFRDFVFANVLTILKMLFLARCCCHQAPTPSLVQIWGRFVFVPSFLFALLHLHTPAICVYVLAVHFFIITVNFSKASVGSDSSTCIVSLWPDLKLRQI